MVTKKRSKSKNGRAKQAAPAAGPSPMLLSTAARSLLNLAVVAATTGLVLIFPLAARFPVSVERKSTAAVH
jgi:hypothetical protein